MEYTIQAGTRKGAFEIYFQNKPSEFVRDNLKALKMRWNGTKKCWWGFADEETLTNAINGEHIDAAPGEKWSVPETFGSTVSDGYMGAIETTGDIYASGQRLYGADLSKAIRESLKKCGFRGFSVSVKTFSGGQEIQLKVKASHNDLLNYEEYKANYKLSGVWCYNLSGENILTESVYFGSSSPEEQKAIIEHNARITYDFLIKEMQGESGLNYHKSDAIYTAEFVKKLNAMQSVLDAYNHDGSNSMVDYFDRHFYDFTKIYLKD